VKVLIAGDLGGRENSARHGLLSCGIMAEPNGRESSKLYTLH